MAILSGNKRELRQGGVTSRDYMCPRYLIACVGCCATRIIESLKYLALPTTYLAA